MQKRTTSYKDLIVWQRAVELATHTYELTSRMPPAERFGLSSQMQRAAVSIASNIAEGYGRGTRKDYAHFLRVARGSLYELNTHISILKRVRFGGKLDYNEVVRCTEEVGKMLTVMIQKVSS